MASTRTRTVTMRIVLRYSTYHISRAQKKSHGISTLYWKSTLYTSPNEGVREPPHVLNFDKIPLQTLQISERWSDYWETLENQVN